MKIINKIKAELRLKLIEQLLRKVNSEEEYYPLEAEKANLLYCLKTGRR